MGVENYLLSQKMGPVRMFLRLTGAQTDKEMGPRKLRIVAEQGHYFKPHAKILLAIAALRDKNKTLAGRLMAELTREFPRNDLASKIQLDPRWSMIAGVLLATHPSVYTAVHESLRYLRREQEVIEAHPLVGRPTFALVIPERPQRPVWVQLPESIGPALR